MGGKMDFLFHVQEQNIKADIIGDSILHTLIRECVKRVHGGNIDEGMSFLAQARRMLTLEQSQLAAILDQIAEGYTAYCQLYDSLLHAEEGLLQFERQQQTRFTPTGEFLSTSEEIRNISQQSNSQSSENVPSVKLSANGTNHQLIAVSQMSSNTLNTLPDLYITCFGHFEVYQQSSLLWYHQIFFIFYLKNDFLVYLLLSEMRSCQPCISPPLVTPYTLQ